MVFPNILRFKDEVIKTLSRHKDKVSLTWIYIPVFFQVS